MLIEVYSCLQWLTSGIAGREGSAGEIFTNLCPDFIQIRGGALTSFYICFFSVACSSKWSSCQSGNIWGKCPQILSQSDVLLLFSRLCLLHLPYVIDYLCNSSHPRQIGGMLYHSASMTALHTYIHTAGIPKEWPVPSPGLSGPHIFLFGTPCPDSSLGVTTTYRI